MQIRRQTRSVRSRAHGADGHSTTCAEDLDSDVAEGFGIRGRRVYHDAVTFDELTEIERIALAGLVRLMVRMDGEFSPQEVKAVSSLAREVGATSFWSLMNEVQTLEMDELAQVIGEVKRDEVRDWMYGVLVGLAAVDGLDESESELLDWLMEAWSMTG